MKGARAGCRAQRGRSWRAGRGGGGGRAFRKKRTRAFVPPMEGSRRGGDSAPGSGGAPADQRPGGRKVSGEKTKGGAAF